MRDARRQECRRREPIPRSESAVKSLDDVERSQDAI